MADLTELLPPDEANDAASQDPIWGNEWNPHQNRWSPSDEPSGPAGWFTEPVHGDVHVGTPISDSPGHPDMGGGTTSDARLAEDSVAARGPGTPPVPIIKHEIHTFETGSEYVRSRTVIVNGNITPTRLLEENPNRKRALIKLVTSNSVVLIGPAFGAMGAPQLTAVPTQPVAAWAQATGDPNLEIKAQGAIDAIGVLVNGVVLVSIWEEVNSAGGPGVGG